MRASMTGAIHYIGAGYDYEFEHMHTPITKSELPADEVIILTPEESDLLAGQYHQQLISILEEETEVTVQKQYFGEHTLSEAGFEEVYRYAYRQLTTNLQENKEVFINISNSPVFVRYAFIYATYTLLVESTQQNPIRKPEFGVSPDYIRENIQFYETQGLSYFPDIFNSLGAFSELLTNLETTSERQKELITDLQNKGQKYQDILQLFSQLLQESEHDQAKWQDISRDLKKLSPNRPAKTEQFETSIDNLDDGLHQVFEGLATMMGGLDTLADDQLRKDILNSRHLTQVPHHNDLTSLLDIANTFFENTESNGTPSSIRSLHAMEQQIEEMLDVAQELSIRQQDIERFIEQHERNLIDTEVQENGVTYGAVEFERGQHYLELPIPTAASLRDLEAAVILSLYMMDSADSIAELIDQLLLITIQMMVNDDLKEDESDTLLALQENLRDHEDDRSQLQKELIRSLRSKIQYNLNQLQEKGFILKEKQGRSNKLRLTQSGELWIIANEFDRDLMDFPSTPYPKDVEKSFQSIKEELKKTV